MNWFLLHVKLNEEENVAQMFREMSIDAYCPPATANDHSNQQRQTGYLYVKLTQKYKGIVFGIPNVLGFITNQGKPILATDDEINILKNNAMPSYQVI